MNYQVGNLKIDRVLDSFPMETQLSIQDCISLYFATGTAPDPSMVSGSGYDNRFNVYWYPISGEKAVFRAKNSDNYRTICTGCKSPWAVTLNFTDGFYYPDTQKPSHWLACTLEGTIEAYIDGCHHTKTVLENNASYRGITIFNDLLYLADFKNSKIDVYDKEYKLLNGYPFLDNGIPISHHISNVLSYNNEILVVYTSTSYHSTEDPYNLRTAYINSFTPEGILLQRIMSNGNLCCQIEKDSISIRTSESSINVYQIIGGFGVGDNEVLEVDFKFPPNANNIKIQAVGGGGAGGGVGKNGLREEKRSTSGGGGAFGEITIVNLNDLPKGSPDPVNLVYKFRLGRGGGRYTQSGRGTDSRFTKDGVGTAGEATVIQILDKNRLIKTVNAPGGRGGGNGFETDSIGFIGGEGANGIGPGGGGCVVNTGGLENNSLFIPGRGGFYSIKTNIESDAIRSGFLVDRNTSINSPNNFGGKGANNDRRIPVEPVYEGGRLRRFTGGSGAGGRHPWKQEINTTDPPQVSTRKRQINEIGGGGFGRYFYRNSGWDAGYGFRGGVFISYTIKQD